MKISVVTISYNQAPYLERCVNSVLSQQGVDLEYIIVDACSIDGSGEILERYRDRLSELIIEQDKGPADGLNKGFARATGEIFYFLNSDDMVLPGAFSRVAKAFENHPKIDVIYGDGFIVDTVGRRQRPVYSARKITIYGYLTGADGILQQAMFFRRRAFEKTRGFKVNNRTCWDGELLLDMAKTGAKFMHVPEFWGEFRLYPESISGSGGVSAQYIEDRNRMFRDTYGRDRRWWDGAADLLFRVANKASVAMRHLRLRRDRS